MISPWPGWGFREVQISEGKKQLWPTLQVPQTLPAHHHPCVLTSACKAFKCISKARGQRWAGHEDQRPAGRQRCALTAPDARRKHRLVQNTQQQQQKKKSKSQERGVPGAWSLGGAEMAKETGTKLPASGYSVNCWGSGNHFPIED